ncbi:uncharacterized protein NPIL_35991 [Nephila pilipes]|uniref:Uncharacterized protein n=1 Tax=Nephila pilipes TaxID=299642 RepID=A0A8X6UE50_NEPPI|nr:uncharacterized protein NPIL_35991 [Nephila pilipes]
MFDRTMKLQRRCLKTRFLTYSKVLCKQSLITGFPVIASTRNGFHKALKILVFVLCTCGFLYQTFSFLKLFKAYPTLVDFQVEKPDIIPLPSISLCNKNRIRRRIFCTSFPEVCRWFKRTSYCLRYTPNCLEGQTDEEIVLAAPSPPVHANMNRSQEFVRIFGQRQKDLVQDCRVQRGAISLCKNYVSFVAPDKDGYPNNCIAIESLWEQPNMQPQSVPVTSRISLRMTIHPEENFNYFDSLLAHILVHESRSIGNPMMEGITLKPGKTYDLFINERIIERLPPPYKTNCTDYLMLWMQNGGRGPFTEKGCREKCKMRLMMNSEGCVAQSLSYPHIFPICTDKNLFPSENINEKCMKECSEACNEVAYDIRSEIKLDQSEREKAMNGSEEYSDGQSPEYRSIQPHWRVYGYVAGNLPRDSVRSFGDPLLPYHLSIQEEEEV